jgi:hypothetical protein
MQAYGFAAGDVFIAIFAVAIGSTHGMSWVILPAALGVGCDAWQVARIRTRQHQSSPSDTTLADWWRRHGLWQMLASSLPVYLALVASAVALARH